MYLNTEMWDQSYYYIDECFQLELNLQSIRRALIQMLEEFEASDCTRCNLIKCRCEPHGLTPPLSIIGSSTSLTWQTVPSWDQGPSDEPRNTPISPRSFAEVVGGQVEVKSPPAFALPRPEFKTSNESNPTLQPFIDRVESWVRASTPNPDKTDSPGSKPYDSLTYAWPPAVKSVWNDYKDKINQPEINTGTISQTGNVQDFFKSFNVNMYAVGNKTYLQNRALMEKLKAMGNKQEYTYF